MTVRNITIKELVEQLQKHEAHYTVQVEQYADPSCTLEIRTGWSQGEKDKEVDWISLEIEDDK